MRRLGGPSYDLAKTLRPELALVGSANTIKTPHSNTKKAPGGVNPLLQGLGGYTQRVRLRAPTEASKYETLSCQELPQVEPHQNLTESAHSPPKARGLLLGTIKWGTLSVYRKNHFNPIKNKARR